MSDEFHLYRDLRAAGRSRRSIRTALARNALGRPIRGVYAAARGTDDRFQKLRALLARLPPGTVLGYESAAALHGFIDADLDATPVHVILPHGTVRPRIRGVVCHESRLPVTSPSLVAGVPYAPAARVAIDLARASAPPDGLAILDTALRVGPCDMADLVAEVDRHDGLRGARRARGLVPLADGRAACAGESHLRFALIDGCLPAPEPQVYVTDQTGRQYWIDLAYRERKIGLDFDGRSHPTFREIADDRIRANWLTARGWTMRCVTETELYHSPELVVAELRAMLY